MQLLRAPQAPSLKTYRPGVGKCAACERRVDGGDKFVRVYGELFHHTCVLYRPRNGHRS